MTDAKQLAGELSRLLGELQRTRRVIWQREAELAAGVPVSARPDETEHLAQRLEAVLRTGAEAAGCQSAAAYLLDDATSLLKLRTAWGLPTDRFCDPPRPLRGALADLEALLGHAVVLDNTALRTQWRCPEPCASAVCVPISTPTTPLGTLWVFGQRARNYTSVEVNILEIIAGRVAAELKREMLLRLGVHSRQLDRQLTSAANWQSRRQPNVAPLLDHFQVAGWTSPAEWVGGDFHDWSVLPTGELAVAVGQSEGQSLEAALTAAAVQTAVRAHSAYRHSARQMLTRVNDTLWTSSAGDQFASLFYALIDPETGRLDCCCAGAPETMLIRERRYERLAERGALLGLSPDSTFRSRRTMLQPGDVLAVLSGGVREVRGAKGEPFDLRALARQLRRQRKASAEQLAALTRQCAGRPPPRPNPHRPYGFDRQADQLNHRVRCCDMGEFLSF